jgi:signal transduction histidine kinase
MNDRMTVVWAWLAGSGLAVLLLGVLFALRLGRWVARPLTVLGTSAARFGDGALETRAPIGTGPNEVRELSVAFNRMAERIQSLIGSHRDWVADVSHQLRTPLTALRLRVDVLADEADESTAAEMAGLRAELTRLGGLVDGLLAVARAEANVPRPETVRADEIAADRVAAWEPVARERGVSLSAQGSRPAAARLGPGDLEQMLDNLIANALDSVPESGGVEVSVTSAAQRIVVSVTDDGPGMSEQARENAFRRFGRSGTGGNGLGLAIVQRIASANGAEVALEETPGGGLTVVLRLPVPQ